MDVDQPLNQEGKYTIPFSEFYGTLRDQGYTNEDLEDSIINETSRLRGLLKADSIPEVLERYAENGDIPGGLIGKEGVIVPNMEVRRSALLEARELFHLSGSPYLKKLLKQTYKENECYEIRVIAGESLGYSKLKTGFHELNILTPTKLKITTAFIGLGIFVYGLYELNKLFNG